MWHAVYAALANFSRLVWKRDKRAAQVLERNGGSSPLVTILCLLAEDQDRSLITDLCQRSQWKVLFAATREDAERILRELTPQIILFDRDMAGADWREFVTCFAAASRGTCIMLVSTVMDDYLWNELVANGGYEVLRKPLREDEVSHAVRMAWSYWSSATERVSNSKR